MMRPVRTATPAKPTGRHPAAFDFSGERLHTAWDRLHAGDLEPWPGELRATQLWASTGAASTGDAATLARALQDAWRHFHEGDFAAAHARGVALGPAGAGVALAAASEQVREQGADAAPWRVLAAALKPLADALSEARPAEPNSHFRFALLQLEHLQAQPMRVLPDWHVLREVHAALQRTLQVTPRHAAAQLALGRFHAQAIGRLGLNAARAGCAASTTAAEHHLELARRLQPGNPRVWLETARAQQLLAGMRAGAAVTEALRRAARLRPRDGASARDVALAAALLA